MRISYAKASASGYVFDRELIQLDTGLATVDKTCKYATSYPQVLQKLQAATEGAKKDRLGIFEYVIQHIHSQS
jgi:hypothetical protein